MVAFLRFLFVSWDHTRFDVLWLGAGFMMGDRGLCFQSELEQCVLFGCNVAQREHCVSLRFLQHVFYCYGERRCSVAFLVLFLLGKYQRLLDQQGGKRGKVISVLREAGGLASGECFDSGEVRRCFSDELRVKAGSWGRRV